MNFNIKQKGQKSPEEESLLQILNSPAVLASGISIIFLSPDLNELCDRLKLLLQEKQAGNSSNINDEEFVVKADKL